MVHFVPVAIREMFAFISTESAQRLKSKSNQDASIHLDYCNSLLIGLPQKSLYKLQMVQNSAAVSLPKTPLFHHITPVLQQLHWLPVKFRIQFKILVYTFKAIHNFFRLSLSVSVSKMAARLSACSYV